MTMKNKTKLYLFLLTCLLTVHANANPILVSYISELQVTQDGWTIELHSVFEDIDLTGWRLTSRNDTAYFKDGIIVGADYLIITQDSLMSPFSLNPSLDTLALLNTDGYALGSLIYGSEPQIESYVYSLPVAPLPHQSISYNYDGTFYYLDNTPTFGAPNDSANAWGHLYGTVTDTLGNPLNSVLVNGILLTDSTGSFHEYNWARLRYINFEKDNYQNTFVSVMVHPDSSVFITIEMKESIHAVEDPLDVRPESYALSPNYPNPFNNATSFTYHLPIDMEVDITVFNTLGQVVTPLFSGFQPAGTYQAHWKATFQASGVYVYQLRTPERVLNRKCLLLK